MHRVTLTPSIESDDRARDARPSRMGRCLDESNAYYTLRALTTYSGIGLRTLRTYLTHSMHPLPHFRVGGKILVRRSDFDDWIRPFRRGEASRTDAMVDDLVKGL
jgi:hypothetical protein